MKKILLQCVCAAFISLINGNASAQTITTFAGNGVASGYGDGVPATAAAINPEAGAIVADAAGNIYIADLANQKVRKISTSGIITNFAGTGVAGYNGDGIPATDAQLNNPQGLAIDAAGNMYIGDVANSRVRKINTSGMISTVAGCGLVGSSGDGGPATNAKFIGVYSVAVDGSGNLIIADVNTNRIRRVNTAGIINTIAGNGTAGYGGDGAAATAAELDQPVAIALDGSGNVYIADKNNNRIRMVTTAGIITTIAGNGFPTFAGDGSAATAGSISGPNGVAVDIKGNVYISDLENDVIRQVNTSGVITTIAGLHGMIGFMGDGGPATSALFNAAGGIGTDAARNIYFGDILNYRIRKISACSLPVAAPISGTDTVCPASTVTLTDATTGGAWLSSDASLATVSGGVVTGVASGNVKIEYVVINSCATDTSYFPFKVRTISSCTLGIETPENIITPSLFVFPNPSQGTFTVSVVAPSREDVHIIISNILGRKVKEIVIKDNKDANIELNVVPGIYYLSAVINGERLVKKIAIN